MRIPSFSFLLYFLPVMLLVYFLLSFSRKAQNLWLTVCGVAYLALNSFSGALLFLAVVLVNIFLGGAVSRCVGGGRQTAAKRLVALSCACNLLPLLAYRHLPPLYAAAADVFGWEAPPLPAVPLGLSFLALRGISYVVDIYRGIVRRNPSAVNAALYLTFFPALPAGPIIRYRDMAWQTEKRKATIDDMAKGLYRLVVGLGKVVLLSRPLLSVGDIVFEQSGISGIYTSVPVSLAWLGLLAFGLGLYHCLSGYGDIVVGLGGILGFTCPENFRYPCLAASVGEFWDRCYASLAEWFSEYVYRPLEKKRANNDWMVLHTLLMWTLIGLWIGPGLPKLIFAVWTFFFIVVERIIEIDPLNTKSPLRRFFVALYVLVALVALKTDTVYRLTLFLANLLGMGGGGLQSGFALLLLRENGLALLAGLVALFPLAPRLRDLADGAGGTAGAVVHAVRAAGVLILAALVAVSISGADYDPYQIIRQYLWR